ncbi:ABC transporter ATP-binding protein/permease [Mycoplasmopsis bovigenitalium]|uniref:Mbov_0121 family peptidase domain-containing ABC transporter n=1 Tax=Mycoplasmopsis bovigenitalium TaxID=2112 RepID=UPI00090B23B7|nr:cysteine peptidase family C39 domain-containing protein [Mycoplasmopsis bovigenitalium]BAW18415.1 ABC transporter ATP-binding protein/permease [Mycoplasmopsis bovigenitalium]
MKITKQYDTKDCGLHVLQYLIQKINNEYIEIENLKLMAQYGEQGISLANLTHIGDKFGVKLDSYEVEFEKIITFKNDELPFVVLVDNKGSAHYLVVEKITNSSIYVQDSSTGKKTKLSFEKFKQIYAGICSFVYKSTRKINSKLEKIENKIKSYFVPTKNDIWLILISLISIILCFSTSFFVKIVFDNILPNKIHKALVITFVAFIWLNIIRFISSLIKNIIVEKIANKIEFNLKSIVFEKLLKLQSDQKSKLTNIEILKRIGYIRLISEYKANFIYSFSTDLITIILSCSMLIWISLKLFLIISTICLIASGLNLLFKLYFDKSYSKQIEASHDYAQKEFDSIYCLESFNNSLDKNYLELVRNNSFVNFKKQDFSLKKNKYFNDFVVDCILANLTQIIVFAGTLLFYKNEISIGTIVMILTISNFFVSPTLSLSAIIMTKNIIDKHVNMINFLLNIDHKEFDNQGIKLSKIDSIQLNNIDFGYENSKPIFKKLNMLIDKNARLVGENGSGKSTLLKLLNLRFYNFSGKLFFNNNACEIIDKNDLLNNSILLNNQIYMPNDTIINFLTSQKIEKTKTLYENLEKFKLNEILENLNLDLSTTMMNNASNLSSGQRQFVILLKLFTQKFQLIMLDEAFENIENRVYKKLKKAINNYQDSALFIEISHNAKIISNAVEVKIEKTN